MTITAKQINTWTQEVAAARADNSANMATCKGVIQGLTAERDTLRTQNTALLADKEVLLSHMDTFMRVSNDPAIYNLAKVVIERFAEGKD